MSHSANLPKNISEITFLCLSFISDFVKLGTNYFFLFLKYYFCRCGRFVPKRLIILGKDSEKSLSHFFLLGLVSEILLWEDNLIYMVLRMVSAAVRSGPV